MGECIERIREYTAGDRSRFVASRLIQDAVIRNLQTLTESSQRLSDDIKRTEGQVPWRDLAGFRNVIVHGYLGIDLAAVWLVVDQDLPPLAAALARMIDRIPREN
ncbi:HepT-like ribonuclease domain-containing protein [Ramlibacter sp.]|uniref:HepT-like ribonuclease domain-containing protein n=1 Tax=Ramlibacter sp. TaxID=1917967 RepID=UPI003D10B968